jgi:hypothetical protein
MEINHSKQDIAGNLAHVWAGMARADEATAALATIEAKHAEIQASVDALLRKLGVA